MDYQKMTLEELKRDMIDEARMGYPLFVAGALYWLVMGILGFFIEGQTLALCYLLGLGSIFPMGILFSKLLKVNFLSKNPLGTFGGIVGGMQALFLPLWVVIYIERYELVPMSIGIMVAAHFLPYVWIYKSKTYLFLTVAMALVSLVFGYIFIDKAFSLLPFLLMVLYVGTVIGLIVESGSHGKRLGKSGG